MEARAMMNIHVGTSGFAHKEWKGKFYPEKLPSKDMLRFYAERLNTVEINNTFYHMPKESVLMSWSEQVPDDYVFSLKAPQVITHVKRLKNVFEETEYLFKALSVLDRKLGPVLFQFPKSFYADQLALENFLGLIPGAMACTFEFRNPSWFDAGITDLLRKKGCSLCIADTDENPAQVIISTAPWGYLRLRRSDYTEADLSQWLEKILSQKWERAFVYFKHEDEAKGADIAMHFQELVDARLDGGKRRAGMIRKTG
jgi:uncharacterized protein YecE (DUF72 family)